MSTVRTRVGRIIVVLPFLFGVTFHAGWPRQVQAAEQTGKPRKSQASPSPKKAAPKGQGKQADGTPASLVAKSGTCPGETPHIDTVHPDEGRVGEKITISGTHFGPRECLSMVSFGPGSPAKILAVEDSVIRVTVPPAKKGLRLLTVTTAAGQDSKPFLLR